MEPKTETIKRGRGRPKGQVHRVRTHFYIDERVLKNLTQEPNKSLFVEIAVKQRLIATGRKAN